MRYCYGTRLRILHERSSLLNGIALFMSDKAKPLDPELFCWTGQVQYVAKQHRDGDRPQDHLVAVLAAQISRDGVVDYDALMETYKVWTEAPSGESEQQDG